MSAVIMRLYSDNTDRQYSRYNLDAIFNYLVGYKQAHDGNSPTVREIMDACDISSTSVTMRLLEQLQEAKRIRLRRRGIYRGIEVIGGKWQMSTP